MSTPQDYASISDASKPNAGRIYDYMLGGSHNFEVDRQAAQAILNMIPGAPNMVRLVRWFLGEAVRRMCDAGFRHFVDFASGLPTVDHIHYVAPAGSKVIYSDIDPVTVAYGQDIVKDNPNIRYLACNAATPEILLQSKDLTELMGKQRKVTVGFNGIAWFLPDDQVAHALRTAYDWAAPGSRLFLTDNDVSSLNPQMRELMEIYKNMGQPSFPRSVKTLKELVQPWKVSEPGPLALEEWVGIGKRVTNEIQNIIGTGIVGCIFEK